MIYHGQAWPDELFPSTEKKQLHEQGLRSFRTFWMTSPFFCGFLGLDEHVGNDTRNRHWMKLVSGASISNSSDALLNNFSPDITHPPTVDLNGASELIVDY